VYGVQELRDDLILQPGNRTVGPAERTVSAKRRKITRQQTNKRQWKKKRGRECIRQQTNERQWKKNAAEGAYTRLNATVHSAMRAHAAKQRVSRMQRHANPTY